VYWDTNDAGQRIQLSSTSVFNAIDDVMNKRVTAKNSENFVERMARVRVPEHDAVRSAHKFLSI
jgi:mevalonate pyrophosphate decarboxylase